MAVSYINQNTTAPITGLTVNINIPSSTLAGDLVLLYVFHRSALTLPLGFTLVDTVSFAPDGATTQYLSVYKLVATGADIGRSVVISQSGSLRLGAVVNVFRGSIATPEIAVIDKRKEDAIANNPLSVAMQAVAATEVDQLAVALLSVTLSSSSNDYTAPSGFTKSYTTGVNDKRLFSVYRAISSPDTASGNFTTTITGGPQAYGTFTLILTDTGGVPVPANVRVTQAPVLVLERSSKATRVTQAPVLVLSVPTYPIRLTQAPVLAPYLPKPPPLPRVFVPDTPLTETIEFYTAINQSFSGNEQRVRLRDNPRVTMQLLIPVETGEERRELYYFIEKYLRSPVLYPYYQYSDIVAAAAPAGATRLDFNTKYVNIVAGDTLAVFDPQLENTYYLAISGVDANGADLAEPLPVNVGRNWRVSGTGTFILNPLANMVMHHRHGVVNLTLMSTSRRLVSPNNDTVLPAYNGVPIAPMRHLAPADEALTFDTRRLDNSIGRVGLYTEQVFMRMGGPRDYVVSRGEGINLFNKFLDYTGGMHKPFYMPTYFDDLELVAPPTPGQRVIRSRNIYYADLWKGGAWRTLRIDTAAGIKYRVAQNVALVYDANGNAVACDITLDTALGGTSNDNTVRMISFMPLCRFSDDRITLTHHAVDTTVSTNIAVVIA